VPKLLVNEDGSMGDRSEVALAGLLLVLLTPIVKSWPSKYGLKANDLAIQVLGGSGYIREYPVESQSASARGRGGQISAP